MSTLTELPPGAVPARVMVADADPLIGEGLALSLHQPPRLTAWAQAGSAQQALDAAQELYPAVLLAGEAVLQDLPSHELAQRLDGGRAARLLVVGQSPDSARMLHYLLLGCMGYLSRQDSLETLRKAISAVAAGEFWAPRALLPALVRELRDRRDREPALTAREREILSLMHTGRTNTDIARVLFISDETVRWHARRLFAKIGARNRTAAIEFAQHHGMIWRGAPLPPVAERRPLRIVSRTG